MQLRTPSLAPADLNNAALSQWLQFLRDDLTQIKLIVEQLQSDINKLKAKK